MPVAPGDAPGAVIEPFAPRQLWRIDQAMSAANRDTGLTFSVYVGDLDEPTRQSAELLHKHLGERGDPAVLIALSPNQRVVEIVTCAQARRLLPDRVCALAILSMTGAFEVGDLAGGIVIGLSMLAEQARS